MKQKDLKVTGTKYKVETGESLSGQDGNLTADDDKPKEEAG